MAHAFIGLGSNLGDGQRNLLAAWQRLQEEAGRAVALSPPFLTEPVGMESDQLFTNAVGLLETGLAPQDLLEKMMGIEAELGRDRQKGRDRTVDLDLLYYDDLVSKTSSLTLPHPEIANRRFVLAPLAAVAPLHVHPVLRLTSLDMLQRLVRQTGVTQIFWEKT
ncbi:MAG: 2-amino-4-hydroxy-6-hydroxymethyldihydropteridine diphosphokinase [Proteobacteria bacterium]|nr:2-amino-4-hydroxy-6-hydroxymethyldihydropteridine diphosphokinase [Pseudomonadota bacterium]MBU4297792.1 2-amino-4-hydroxy-6-hydroxymethyldihydropteridine diphosphokinase [Pseudomonadota bacterium]MCG2748327.1 2-amino-4-hydroxy-6-hydroxymethyldihydropteridine diphosphokinase [Desulfobulbaceae bacterium]